MFIFTHSRQEHRDESVPLSREVCITTSSRVSAIFLSYYGISTSFTPRLLRTPNQPPPDPTLGHFHPTDPDNREPHCAQQAHTTQDLHKHNAPPLHLITKITQSQRVLRIQPGDTISLSAALILICMSDDSPFRPWCTITCDDSTGFDFLADALEQPLGALVALEIFKPVSLVP